MLLVSSDVWPGEPHYDWLGNDAISCTTSQFHFLSNTARRRLWWWLFNPVTTYPSPLPELLNEALNVPLGGGGACQPEHKAINR